MADYIKREDVLAQAGNCYDNEGNLIYAVGTGNILRIPAADVKPVVRGKWIKKEPYEVWKCSVCEVDNMYAYSYGDDDYELQDFYCPHCGTKMDGNDKNA